MPGRARWVASRARWTRLLLAVTVWVTAGVGGLFHADPSDAASLPSGFQEQIVLSGLTAPTAVRFANHGRVFVAEKSGIIKVFDNLSDTTPTVFADLRTQVHNYWDRGLLGLALDPQFPTNPWVYVLYTHDAAIGGHRAAVGRTGWHIGSLPQFDKPRLRCQRPCVAPAGGGRRDDRCRGRADRGLVSAVPESLHRKPRLRSRRRALRQRRRGRRLRVRRLRAAWRPDQSLRRPAGCPWAGRRRRRPRKVAPCGPRTAARTPTPSVSTVRSCAWIPPRATGCRATRGTRTPT